MHGWERFVRFGRGDNRSHTRDFIDVGKQDEIIRTSVVESGEHGIALMVLAAPVVPRSRSLRHVVDDDVPDAIRKAGKSFSIVLKMERLGVALKRYGRLGNHEYGNDRRKLVQANFEELELV
jgi:hypothetical protein